MATLLLSAAGSGLGGAFGGSVLGLGGAAVGRAAGAMLGRSVDQRLMGAGSDAVETGRIERFRLQGAGEGTAIDRVFGRMRIAGQVIWASRFRESVTTHGGGKGGPPVPETREFSYTVSLALALCEGTITRVNRVWADGREVGRDTLDMAVHHGAEDQLPDATIAAVEGADRAPAYRGTAYVVISDLDLGPFGGRVPQFTFEVLRPAHGNVADEAPDLPGAIRGVALIPGTGEYSLATTPVHYDHGPGQARSANVHAPGGTTDLAASLAALSEELPRLRSVAVIVSWFGDDLRCGSCTLNPRVEQTEAEGEPMAWSVAGVTRGAARHTPPEDREPGPDGEPARPLYGGTPADAAVVEAIRAVAAEGHEAMFYPFILMTQEEGNALPDPWGGASQPVLPWRGRITTSLAPGRPGTPDRTGVADAEVAAFFGDAEPGDFALDGERVVYSGPDEWSYRRFILHYAWLCRAAGGVASFCIGSEMRSLTQIRGAGDGFPAVAQLVRLAADVRSVLGPDVDLGYAADWSEYFGYHPQDGSGDVRFHLDPLWASPAIDFVGIDNYMPLSDWRDGDEHADAAWGSVHDLDYLRANVAGGEGYDWFYASRADRDAQRRTPIADGAHGEPWVFRYKDLRGWWENPHHDRVGGVRAAAASPWVPRSKPIRFTEFGCAAIDRGTNQPNKFLDPKSSESALPHHSHGLRDEVAQQQYYRAVVTYWADPAANPVSPLYGGAMVDMERAHAWAWDARPWPAFPRTVSVWSDGPNYALGHWLNGRTATRPLSSVVREICEAAGLSEIDVSGLHGTVRGYRLGEVDTARAALQPLMLAHGFDATERDGVLRFAMRGAGPRTTLEPDALVETDDLPLGLERVRGSQAETPDRVRLGHLAGEEEYEAKVAEATIPGRAVEVVSASDLDMALTVAEGRAIAERWLAEARVSRDTMRVALPPSRSDVGAGDVVEIVGRPGRWRIDRVEDAGARVLEGTRIEPRAYARASVAEEPPRPTAFAAPVPLEAVFLDLPLLSGDEVEHAPHLAVTASPWTGPAALHASATGEGWTLDTVLRRAAAIGRTWTPLRRAEPGLWDRGPALRVAFGGGTPPSGVEEALVQAGANAAAIGDGSTDRWEVFQFAVADPAGAGAWDLSLRLRGQAGTDELMPDAWPAGSVVVLLDGAPAQTGLKPSQRGLERHYRIGPASRPLTDPSHRRRVEAFDGVGLRPYAPAHLRLRRRGGDLAASWVRRTRIDGDGWAAEVPLGEAREAYRVEVVAGGRVLREATVGEPRWLYAAADRAADADAGPRTLRVAQVSDRYGPGLFTEVDIDG